MANQRLLDMQTTQTTATTPSSGKKVWFPKAQHAQRIDRTAVCVSSHLIDEIKRIIKESEILKYASLFILQGLS